MQLRQRDDRTGNRCEHFLNRRDDVRNRPDQIGNRRRPHREPAGRRIGNRRRRNGNRRHRNGNRRHIRNRSTRPRSYFWSVVSVPPGTSTGLFAPVEGLLAWLPARAKRARYALNRLPQSASDVVDRAACGSATLA